MLNPFQTQIERNRETRTPSGESTDHASRVMQSILKCRQAATDRLCILGAGNGNDIRLEELAEQFATVRLVDVDNEALQSAVSAHTLDNVTVEVTDLGGWYSDVAKLEPDTEKDEVFDTIAAPTNEYTPSITDAPFDVVVSTCVLSQIIDSTVGAMGHDYPRLAELVFAVRQQHLRSMIASLTIWGRGLLITDFVSSDTLPQLLQIPPEQLAREMGQAIESGNFFTGLNPAAIFQMLQMDPSYSLQLTRQELSLPWVWQMGQRAHAVAAIGFQRRK